MKALRSQVSELCLQAQRWAACKAGPGGGFVRSSSLANGPLCSPGTPQSRREAGATGSRSAEPVRLNGVGRVETITGSNVGGRRAC